MNREKDPPRNHTEDVVDLMDIFRAVLRHARRIVMFVTAVAVAALLISLMLPKYYMAETRILPPTDKGSNIAAQLLGQGGTGLIGLAGGMPSMKSQGELFIALLKSRTILDRIIDRFDLMNRMKTKFRQDARSRLMELVSAKEERKSGIIVLSVEDRDPKRAAEIANAFVEELRLMKSGLAISEAGQRRMFFEEQIFHTKESLGRAEEDIKLFQQKTGIFQIDAQAKAIIEGIARLRAQIAFKEVEGRVLRSFAAAQNPDLQRVDEEVRALRVELAKLETAKGNGFDPIMSSGRIPEMGVEYLRKLRHLKYNETLFELLSKQYELAKLDEARDTAVIQVVDHAVPPERKSRPKRGMIVLVSAMSGLFFAVIYVLFLEQPWKRREESFDRGPVSVGDPG